MNLFQPVIPGANASATRVAILIKGWQKINFNAIFIAGNSSEAACFIYQANHTSLSQQIIGSDGIIATETRDGQFIFLESFEEY